MLHEEFRKKNIPKEGKLSKFASVRKKESCIIWCEATMEIDE
jgi:hypothetical protein